MPAGPTLLLFSPSASTFDLDFRIARTTRSNREGRCNGYHRHFQRSPLPSSDSQNEAGRETHPLVIFSPGDGIQPGVHVIEVGDADRDSIVHFDVQATAGGNRKAGALIVLGTSVGLALAGCAQHQAARKFVGYGTVLLGDFLTTDAEVYMGTPAAGVVHDPLWASVKNQGVTTPMLWQAVAKRTAADLEGPLPEVAKAEAGDTATAETRVGSHSRVRRHGCRQFEFRNEREHEFASGRRVCPLVKLCVMVWPVLAMPRGSQHENVCKALRRIDSTTEDAS